MEKGPGILREFLVGMDNVGVCECCAHFFIHSPIQFFLLLYS